MKLITYVALLATLSFAASEDEPDYGVDVSWPIHRNWISTNYDWLPHNVDPENNPTPKEYEGMPVQILGDRQSFYDDFLQGCRDKYKKYKSVCDSTERDRRGILIRPLLFGFISFQLGKLLYRSGGINWSSIILKPIANSVNILSILFIGASTM